MVVGWVGNISCIGKMFKIFFRKYFISIMICEVGLEVGGMFGYFF